MLKGLALSLMLSSAVLAPCAAIAQQGIDPGAFHVAERALDPADAARQVELMSAALNALPAQRPGVVDSYILSIAFWDDPVFESEAKEAAAILGRRYDAAERTIVLSAGKGGGVRAYPAATPNNVQAALGKIGSILDPNEDLMIVFMTSHGAQDGTIAIQEKTRVTGGLHAPNLRQSLQQAGIRNKLVIVSACFSGHFIGPFLMDPNATVLTAAAADKTSFGCEPSREWTFFGDALFNHALRGGADLAQSYNDALALISKWEEDVRAKWAALSPQQRKNSPEPEPSNPQNNLGDGVAPVIAKAESYGNAVNCAGHLSFAFDRAKTSRPLKGLSNMEVLQTARAAAEAKAIAQGAARKRSQQDVARAIAASSASVLQVFNAQSAGVTSRAAWCTQPAED